MKSLTFVAMICAVLLSVVSSHAAKTTGNVKVLCMQVYFKDSVTPPTLATITNKIESAERQYEKFSLRRMDITYETCTVYVPFDVTYTGGGLSIAADAAAADLGFNVNSFDIKVYFHGGHASGDQATVGGSKVWTRTGGSLIHEMGHAFGWGHQNRWAAKLESGQPYNPIDNNGNSDVIDVWSFMTTGTVDTEPAEKWRAKWIPDYYHLKQNTNTTVRLYNYDEPDAVIPTGYSRAMRVMRSTSTKNYFWIGFRAVQVKEVDSSGDPTSDNNDEMRQGLVFYWERVDQAANGELGGASPVALDLHYGGGKATNDQSLQPGETYSDAQGDVHITNLGRGGTNPNEYIDVQVNTGTFPGNQAPEPTWDAPFSWLVGEPLVMTVTPNDPDGDPVACMWTIRPGVLAENTSATTVTNTWGKAGSFKVTVAVSDMKGQTKTLSRTIAVVDDFPVSQWSGEIDNAWSTGSNWVSALEPTTKTDIAAWGSAFTNANQPLIDDSASHLVRQLRLEPGLDKDVVLTVSGTNSILKIYGGGIDMSTAGRNLTITGSGSTWLAIDQPWVVPTGTALAVETDIDLNEKELTVESQGTTVFSGDITSWGMLRKTGVGTLNLEGVSTNIGRTWVEEGTLSLGSASGIGVFSFADDLTLNGNLQVTIDPSASPGCDLLNVAGSLAGDGSGTIYVSNIGAPTFSTGQIFQVFNRPFPDGETMAIDPVEPAPGMVWANRLAIDGSIAAVAAPSAGTFGHWVRIGSGLFGSDSKFQADPNGDGIHNGLAYFLGAFQALEDSTDLLPAWNYDPGSNAAFVVTYPRLDEATNQVYSAIEYTTNLTDWILAVDGQDGIVETVEDDFFGAGIDRVKVCLCDALAPGGQLFGRLVVLDRLSPEVLLPHYGAWATGLGLTGPDADPTRDLDGDGYTNVEEFLGGTDPENILSK